MKKIVKAKSHIFFVLMAILITVLGGVFCYIYVEKYNHKDLQVNLSQMEQKGTQLVCSDFTLDITSRGGDSGAWIKDLFMMKRAMNYMDRVLEQSMRW